MPTFSELQQRLANAKFRKAILTKLIEHIDENFIPAGDGKEAKFMLLTDDQVKVPVEIFESVVSDTLTPELQQLDAEIAQIHAVELAPKTPEPAKPAEGEKKTTKKKAKETA